MTATLASAAVRTASYAEQHDTGPTALSGTPIRRDTASVATVDAQHTLSNDLFARLGELEEGAAADSYVRNCLIELNLVRYAANRAALRREAHGGVVQVAPTA
ncbi:hypothetical protein ACFYMW_30485 [Streptomyces sp. NPDC006692]|uniref:hypothetical protein n=1 Tax=Streptomyces sp. NPDC006692 TaxID=3364758 RepID=UPI0036BFE411